MEQRLYVVTAKTPMEKMLNEVKEDPAYQTATKKMVQVYETVWIKEIIELHIQKIRKVLPDVEIIGATQTDGNGLVNGFTYDYSGVMLNFMFFQESSFDIYFYDSDKYSSLECAKMLEEAIDRTKDVKGVQLMTTGTDMDMDCFFDHLSQREFDYPYFGMIAGTTHAFTFQGDIISYIFSEQVISRGIAAIVYHGENLHLRVSYLLGWKPIGKQFQVTEMTDFYHVSKIDGKPATDLYRDYLGLVGGQLRTENLCEFPLLVKRGNRLAARIGLRGEKRGNGSVIFGIPVKTGEVLQFSYGNMEEIMEETLEECCRLEKFAPEAVMLIPCMNRRIFFRNEKEDEVDLYVRRFGEIPQFYGNGELYMDKEGGGQLASALVSVGFREGEAKKKEISYYGYKLYSKVDRYVPLEKRLTKFLKATSHDLWNFAKDAIVANKAKSLFLSQMSHEIRTPINAVLGMDEMILRESQEQHIKDYAMDIYTAGSTLLSLINEILDISKIESGKMEILPVEYDLSSMIHDLSSMILMRAKEKNLDFTVSVDSSLPSRLMGDDVRIRQVVTNILTNAVKYTQEGSVHFSVSGSREGKDLLLTLAVEDTGIGIKEEDMPKLTREFERIEESRNRNIEGTGLGMNITTKLLALMGSRLQVESEYGKGSKFYFTLRQPVVDESPVGDFEQRLHQLSQEYQYTNSFTAPEARVLVVDDNSLNRKVFISLLKQTKIQVAEADSGARCLALAADQPYHIIFLDHMMPEMDGIETLHRLKSLEDSPNAHTPVYALTANAVTGAREMYLSEGFDGFLSKPLVSDKLEAVLREELPDDLIQPGEEDVEKKEPVKKEDQDLPMVDGLDWNFARLHLPDRELLEETVREFYELIPHHAGKLEECYEKLGNQEDMGQYRIQVHSMKSVAATIGIIPLAGMANTLEYAARDGKGEVIHAMHRIFLDSWLSYQNKLQGVFGIGQEKKGESADKELVKAKLEMIKVSMLDLDIDQADPIIEELCSYSYEPDIADRMKELKIAVTALEDDRAIEIADQLIDLL